MKIILSRKGFDSGYGKQPSPILPDGTLLSLPIPLENDTKTMADLFFEGKTYYNIIKELKPTTPYLETQSCHLDPDIREQAFSKRTENWKPVFGQSDAAQTHLKNQGVTTGDIFLFFGLFRNVINNAGKLLWDTRSQPRHVMWGWLQIDEVLKVDSCNQTEYGWAKYHPHFHRNSDANNTLYVARSYLTLPGVAAESLAGAGVFLRISAQLALTASTATKPSQWELPQWFYPCDNKHPLTYHSDMARWQRTENGTKLNAVARGQEFILDTIDFPEAIEWLKGLLEDT